MVREDFKIGFVDGLSSGIRAGCAALLQSALVVADTASPSWQLLPPLPEQVRLARARHVVAIATATMDTRFFDTVHTLSR
jgi:hypothetical protein